MDLSLPAVVLIRYLIASFRVSHSETAPTIVITLFAKLTNCFAQTQFYLRLQNLLLSKTIEFDLWIVSGKMLANATRVFFCWQQLTRFKFPNVTQKLYFWNVTHNLSYYRFISCCQSAGHGMGGGGGGGVAKLVFVNPQIQIFYVELGYFWQHLRLDGMSSRKKDKNWLHGKNANRCGGRRGEEGVV